MNDDPIVRLIGRTCAYLIATKAVETLESGGCPLAKLSEAHTRWFVDRLRSAGRAAFDEATSDAAVGKPTEVFAKDFAAAMAAAGRQVAEEFLAGEWSRRN